MRSKIIGACITLVLMLSLCCSVGCLKGSSDDGDGINTDGYGYERPRSAWLTECLLLPSYKDASALFGNQGESGLASGVALELDGSASKDGTYYLVYMLYVSDLPAEDASLETYFELTLFSEGRMRSAKDLVQIERIDCIGNMSAELDMEQPADKRLSVTLSDSKALPRSLPCISIRIFGGRCISIAAWSLGKRTDTRIILWTATIFICWEGVKMCLRVSRSFASDI